MDCDASQRDFMRSLVADLGDDKQAVCHAYAKAERYGMVLRPPNESAATPEQFAFALWNDGQAKGWLTGVIREF